MGRGGPVSLRPCWEGWCAACSQWGVGRMASLGHHGLHCLLETRSMLPLPHEGCGALVTYPLCSLHSHAVGSV